MCIKWGIIGCGDVTEIKSGPAFNKVPGSELVAVMRRNTEKAKDYALRHGVPKWYDDANQLINDPEVNAIYIATPPLFHEEFTVASIMQVSLYMWRSLCRRIWKTVSVCGIWLMQKG